MSGFSGLRRHIEGHFSTMLLVACGLGLLLPGLDTLPNETAVATLAALMFLSFFSLREGEWKTLHWPSLAGYYGLRYVLAPWLLWLAVRPFSPEYAIGVFLLGTLPAAVSSPAIANIYGGAVAPAFIIVIVSQLATPFLVPGQFALLAGVGAGVGAEVIPNPFDLFCTMAWCIFLPGALYLPLRRHAGLAGHVQRNGKLWAMGLVAFVIALVVAKQRGAILAQGFGLLGLLGLNAGCYLLFIALGWLCAKGRPREAQVTYAVCSGFNNAALGVSLALIHFPPAIILFVAVSEIAWSLQPMLFGLFFRRK